MISNSLKIAAPFLLNEFGSEFAISLFIISASALVNGSSLTLATESKLSKICFVKPILLLTISGFSNTDFIINVIIYLNKYPEPSSSWTETTVLPSFHLFLPNAIS